MNIFYVTGMDTPPKLYTHIKEQYPNSVLLTYDVENPFRSLVNMAVVVNSAMLTVSSNTIVIIGFGLGAWYVDQLTKWIPTCKQKPGYLILVNPVTDPQKQLVTNPLFAPSFAPKYSRSLSSVQANRTVILYNDNPIANDVEFVYQDRAEIIHTTARFGFDEKITVLLISKLFQIFLQENLP